MTKDRIACLSDLEKYFSKSGLLGGLTDLEQIQLRTNIGILNYTGEGGQSEVVSITYSALYDLYTRGQLVVGARYVITDFQTIYSSNVLNNLGKKITWGINGSEHVSPIYSIVVIANTNNRLDPRILVLTPEGLNWKVEYDITQETLNDGSKTKGRITYLKDENNNSAYFDFKNILFRRTSLTLNNSSLAINGNYIDLYTFSRVVNNSVSENSSNELVKYNEIKEDCWNNVFLGSVYNNRIESNCQNNTFLNGCHDSLINWNSVNCLFNENICYLTGSIYNKYIEVGNTTLSTAISKTIHKVNDETIVSYLDPITYAYQIIIL